MSKISYVSGQLHRIGDQLSGAAEKKEHLPSPNEDIEKTAPEAAESLRPIPEPEPHIKARFEEMVRLRRDMVSRLTEHLCRFSSEAHLAELRKRELDDASGKLESLLKLLEESSVPEFTDAQFKSKLTESLLQLENMRLEDIRVTAKASAATASPGVSIVKEERPAGAFASLTNGELFRKGLFFFLPLILTVLFATLLISAAFFAAWKIAF